MDRREGQIMVVTMSTGLLLLISVIIVNFMNCTASGKPHEHFIQLACDGNAKNISPHSHGSDLGIEEVVNISAPAAQRIQVDLKTSHDYLRLYYYEPDHNRTGFFTWSSRATLLSLGNNLRLTVYHTRHLNITAECYKGPCGTTYNLTKDEIEIKSLNYPNNYENLWTCSYFFISPPRSTVKVRIIDIALEEDNDYLEIGNGLNMNNPATQIRKLTGEAAQLNISSNGSTLWMRFKTDQSTTNTGFRLRVSASQDEEFFSTSVSERNHEPTEITTAVHVPASESSLSFSYDTSTDPDRTISSNWSTLRIALVSVTGVLFVLVVTSSVVNFQHLFVRRCSTTCTKITHTYVAMGHQNTDDKIVSESMTIPPGVLSFIDCGVTGVTLGKTYEHMNVNLVCMPTSDRGSRPDNEEMSMYMHISDIGLSQMDEGELVPIRRLPQPPQSGSTFHYPQENSSSLY